MSRVRRGILMLAVASSACSRATLENLRGQRLYEAGRYEESYAVFSQALKNGAANPALEYNTGNALYRMKQYEEATKHYRAALAGSRPLRQRSYYNLGNAYVRLAEEDSDKTETLNRAIAAYEEALGLDPADREAKWNLELALKRLDEDRESGGSSGRGRRGDYGRGNMNVPGYEGTPETATGMMAGGGYGSAEGESAEELDEAQARQLLEAVERQALSSHQGRSAGRKAPGGRDW